MSGSAPRERGREGPVLFMIIPNSRLPLHRAAEEVCVVDGVGPGFCSVPFVPSVVLPGAFEVRRDDIEGSS